MMKCEGERFREAYHGGDLTGLTAWIGLSEDERERWRKRARDFDSPDDLSDGENLSELPLGEHDAMLKSLEEILQLRVAYLAHCVRPLGEALDSIGKIFGMPPAMRTPKNIVDEARAVATSAEAAGAFKRKIPPLGTEPLESLVRRQGELLQELARVAGLGDDSKGNEETAQALVDEVKRMRADSDDFRKVAKARVARRQRMLRLLGQYSRRAESEVAAGRLHATDPGHELVGMSARWPEDGSFTKLCRWFGFAQGVMVAKGWASLEGMKQDSLYVSRGYNDGTKAEPNWHTPHVCPPPIGGHGIEVIRAVVDTLHLPGDIRDVRMLVVALQEYKDARKKERLNLTEGAVHWRECAKAREAERDREIASRTELFKALGVTPQNCSSAGARNLIASLLSDRKELQSLKVEYFSMKKKEKFQRSRAETLEDERDAAYCRVTELTEANAALHKLLVELREQAGRLHDVLKEAGL